MAQLSPETLAARIAAAGWEVAIVDLPGAMHAGIRAERYGEKLTVSYLPKFAYARHWKDGVELDRLDSIAAVLEVARTALGRAPFDLEHATDESILAAVAGKTVYWRNSFTGKLETGEVPRGGVHLRIFPATPAQHRILQFADATGQGFRNVRLSSIEEVK